MWTLLVTRVLLSDFPCKLYTVKKTYEPDNLALHLAIVKKSPAVLKMHLTPLWNKFRRVQPKSSTALPQTDRAPESE